MLKVNELFAGIGGFRAALERLGIEHEVVGISEVDKFAIRSYNAIYGETRNYGDISKVDHLDYADMWTYGFPCQDISKMGLLKGIKQGETRSGLLYEVMRLLNDAREREFTKVFGYGKCEKSCKRTFLFGLYGMDKFSFRFGLYHELADSQFNRLRNSTESRESIRSINSKGCLYRVHLIS